MAVALGLVGAASASNITWSYAQTPTTGAGEGFNETLAPGTFNTAGTLVSAQNLGGPEITFDGLTFAATPKEAIGWPTRVPAFSLTL